MYALMTFISAIVIAFFPSDIEGLVSNNKMVEEAECLYYADTIIVALKTQPIFFRSDREELIDILEADIRENYQIREVIISFDKDIYYKITKIDDMKEKGVLDDDLRPDIIKIIETARTRDSV